MNTQTETTKRRLAAMCACVAWLCGCYTQRPPAKPPVNFIAVVHPVIPTPTATGLESPPELAVEVPPAAPQMGPDHFQPAKPHVVAPAAPETSGVNKQTEATIAPEVPTEEMIAAKVEAQRNLDIAEKNLMMSQGKKLNATQADIASKVRGFADNAREAMRSGDWVKAKNLAGKAEVLSEQLAASL
jgi:hypothetical protein